MRTIVHLHKKNISKVLPVILKGGNEIVNED